MFCGFNESSCSDVIFISFSLIVSAISTATRGNPSSSKNALVRRY